MNFEIYAGDSVVLEIDLTKPDGSAYDITDNDIVWYAVDQYGRLNVRYTVGTGVTVVNALAGKLSVFIPKSSITKEGTWRHQLEVTKGVVSVTALDGFITVKPSLRAP